MGNVRNGGEDFLLERCLTQGPIVLLDVGAAEEPEVCFVLLTSQGINACRNKCASRSMSVWERKSVWGGAIHLLLWPGPIISPQLQQRLLGCC